MENVKEFHNAEQQKNEANEAENFDVFIKAMVQAVEKYGRFAGNAETGDPLSQPRLHKKTGNIPGQGGAVSSRHARGHGTVPAVFGHHPK